jgi:Fibronectin type III domain
MIHEHRVQNPDTVMRRLFKMTGLAKFLGGLLIFSALMASVQAAGSVTLSWNRSKDPTVVGYDIYYGRAIGTYTSKVSVGNATNLTISGLMPATTYYFAATAVNGLGIESLFSSAMSYTVPGVRFQVTPTRQFVLTVVGPIGHTYNIQATQDFKTWTLIGTATIGTNGSLNFTDTNAASFSRRFYRTQG